MIGRRSIGAAAGLLVLLGAASAPAQERECWRHSKGYFENVKGNEWVEKYETATFKYTEVERTDRFIELFDRSRNFTVRLLANHYEVKVGGKFQKRLDGKWVSLEINLTATWYHPTKGHTFSVRQVGNTVVWVGRSDGNGDDWTHVFNGTIKGKQIVGNYIDVPGGMNRNDGPATLNFVIEGARVVRMTCPEDATFNMQRTRPK